ncbi:hypothetical protein COO60DRAFT_1474224 [Scenedesmus sp. NREL 46B-D3]|nr:hypothetical protein COO60DRAFT_1474224 [Scenedesmus sp. NREL 46B-D3]
MLQPVCSQVAGATSLLAVPADARRMWLQPKKPGLTTEAAATAQALLHTCSCKHEGKDTVPDAGWHNTSNRDTKPAAAMQPSPQHPDVACARLKTSSNPGGACASNPTCSTASPRHAAPAAAHHLSKTLEHGLLDDIHTNSKAQHSRYSKHRTRAQIEKVFKETAAHALPAASTQTAIQRQRTGKNNTSTMRWRSQHHERMCRNKGHAAGHADCCC